MVDNVIKYKHSSFARSIMEGIRCGMYATGNKLPSERDFCTKYSLSRNTVREGLAALFAEGILVRRGYGAIVSANALRIIEAGHDLEKSRVFVMLNFTQYENPIYRSFFERLRYGLEGSAECIVIFYERVSESLPHDLSEADTVVLLGVVSQHEMRDVVKSGANVVNVNAINALVYSIMPDNYGAGREIASYLYALGHRKIGLALCKPDVPNEFGDRYRGIRDFLHEAGIELHVADVKGGAREILWMNEFLERYLAEDVTAIVCVKDISALTLYECARRKNLMIPEDLSVIGFDDRCYAANVRPALTTVRYPVERLADAAVDTIRQLLRGEEPPRHQLIPMVLLRRESVKRHT